MQKTLTRWPIPDRGVSIVLGLYISLVGFTLSRHGLWYDEVLTARSIDLDLFSMIGERAEAGHPPVFFVLVKAVVSLLGEHELGLRLVSILAGAACALLTYRLLSLSLSDKRLCIFTTMFFVLSCFQLLICQMARSYVLAQLLVLLVLVLVVVERRGWLNDILVLSLSAFATFVHPSAIIALGAYAVVSFSSSRALFPGLAIIAGLSIYIPFIIALGGFRDISDHVAISPAAAEPIDVLRFPGRLLLGQHFDVLPRSVSFVISLSCAYATLISFKERGVPRFCSMSLIVGWSGACVACLFDFEVIGIARYFAGLTPALAVCVGVAFARKLKDPVLPISILSLTSFLLYIEAPPFPEFRTWARLVAVEATHEESIIILSEKPMRVVAAQHYCPRHDLKIIGPAEKMPTSIGAGAWVALSPTSANSLDRLARFVCSNRNYTIAAIIDLHGIRVVHLTEASSEQLWMQQRLQSTVGLRS